jgi:flavin-dependent dehydrogenase
MIENRAEAAEVIVIGGGPAGAAIARLLAARGRTVRILAPGADGSRALGESLPPSTRKALAAIEVLPAVEAAGFCRSRGNRVAWGTVDARLEPFDAEAQAAGYQVWRPDLDRLLLDHAVAAGVRYEPAVVRQVNIESATDAEVFYTAAAGHTRRVRCRFVVDASGRAGVIARKIGRRAQPTRTHAWIGLWRHQRPLAGWALETTLVESHAEGWAWSVPLSPTLRCAAVMIDPDRSVGDTDGALERRYHAELYRTRHLQAELAGADLVRVWGADASAYETTTFGGPQHLVIGDAACFIDPLSSFGVKKALASAWRAAAVVETCLAQPALEVEALDFFAGEERAVFQAQLGQSAGYAARALDAHPGEFWRARAVAPAVDEARLSPAEDPVSVVAAFDQLRAGDLVRLRRSASVRFTRRPAIAGHAVGLEPAVTAALMPIAVRFVDHVDAPALVDLAADGRTVGDLFEQYCRRAAPVPLPNFLKALSVLVAGQALEPAEC